MTQYQGVYRKKYTKCTKTTHRVPIGVLAGELPPVVKTV